MLHCPQKIVWRASEKEREEIADEKTERSGEAVT
jgi:hypothetical protein